MAFFSARRSPAFTSECLDLCLTGAELLSDFFTGTGSLSTSESRWPFLNVSLLDLLELPELRYLWRIRGESETAQAFTALGATDVLVFRLLSKSCTLLAQGRNFHHQLLGVFIKTLASFGRREIDPDCFCGRPHVDDSCSAC